jgi:3-hydroxybutyryl-CoA dehydrogenase
MEISRAGVVGAGFMGSGIAESAASAGIDVTVFEPEDAEELIARIAYTTEMADLDGVDAVLEAVTENPRLKGQLATSSDWTCSTRCATRCMRS